MSIRRPLVRLPWRSRATIAREVDAELAFHLDMRIAELRSRGLGDEEARRVALAEFGDLERTRAYCRREDGSSGRGVGRHSAAGAGQALPSSSRRRGASRP